MVKDVRKIKPSVGCSCTPLAKVGVVETPTAHLRSKNVGPRFVGGVTPGRQWTAKTAIPCAYALSAGSGKRCGQPPLQSPKANRTTSEGTSTLCAAVEFPVDPEVIASKKTPRTAKSRPLAGGGLTVCGREGERSSRKPQTHSSLNKGGKERDVHGGGFFWFLGGRTTANGASTYTSRPALTRVVGGTSQSCGARRRNYRANGSNAARRDRREPRSLLRKGGGNGTATAQGVGQTERSQFPGDIQHKGREIRAGKAQKVKAERVTLTRGHSRCFSGVARQPTD